MPRTGQRGGPQTRAKILEAANWMFLERGYDAVTVADVAREAGVSSVTVFNHFPRKEDLFLDRADEAIDLLLSSVRDRAPGVDVLSSLRDMAEQLAAQRHPFSGLDPRSSPFFRTIAGSPSLVARVREIVAELQNALATQLVDDSRFHGDAALFSALFLAGYSTVMVGDARKVIAGEESDAIVEDHAGRLNSMFEALRSGIRQ